MNELKAYSLDVLQWLAVLFVLLLGFALIAAAFMYLIDRLQTRHAIRRNYPVIGRFRYLFEHLGEFFRQYFFAMDREEMPFNRAVRAWVYRSAKNVDSTIAFGSTRPLHVPGEVHFMNHSFPTLDQDAVPSRSITLGEGVAKSPYTTSSIINISGMSYGAISKPAIRALSMGAKKAGIWMNTGEGGLSSYHLEAGCDIVFQIGTAKYGVRNEEGLLCDDRLREIAAHNQVKMFEIKMSQGAKPGKGGILPAGKVTEEIAKIRGIPVGHDSISPNGHPDIRSVEDLLNMINHVRKVTGKPVGFKAVMGDVTWLDDLLNLIESRGHESAPDFITVDGAEGGTGAAPQPLMDFVGLPLNQSLPIVVNKVLSHNLKDRIKIIASGKLVTPAYVAWALAVGADFVVTARGFMFALGCIQALQCNKNTCPTGITTHNKQLQRGLVPKEKAVRVAHYAQNIVEQVGVIAHSCGVKEPREFKRHHCHVVQANGISIPLNELHPYPSEEEHLV